MSAALLAYGAKTTIFKTTDRGIPMPSASPTFVEDAGAIAGPDNEPQRWQMMRSRHGRRGVICRTAGAWSDRH
jgi:hypothetical protein